MISDKKESTENYPGNRFNRKSLRLVIDRLSSHVIVRGLSADLFRRVQNHSINQPSVRSVMNPLRRTTVQFVIHGPPLQ